MKDFFVLFIFLSYGLSFAQFSGPTVLETDLSESNCIAWGDYDKDGWIDLYITRGNSSDGSSYLNLLFRNISGTLTKQSITGITDILKTSGTATWGDYDNDGWLDLYIAEAQPGFGQSEPRNTLFINNGSGTLTDKTGTDSYGPIVTQLEDARNVGFGDYNNDGYLDVFVKRGNIGLFGETAEENSFYENNSGTSSERNPAGIGDIVTSGTSNIYRNFQGMFVWGDFNNDGFLDIYSARGSTKDNTLWRNNGSGTFLDDTPSVLRPTQTSTQGASWGDYDNDGDLDLFTGTKPEADTKHSFLFANSSTPSTTSFSDVTSGDGGDIFTNEYYVVGSGFADYDNDGDLDLFTSTRESEILSPPSILYQNSGATGGYVFSEIATFSLDPGNGNPDSEGRGMGWVDFNNDGWMDFAVARDGEPLLYTNSGGSNGFSKVQLAGTSNKTGIGSRVQLVANIPQQSGITTQFREISGQSGAGGQDDMRAHFGVGTASKIDTIKVLWQNISGTGAREEDFMTDLPTNKFYVFTQGGTNVTSDVIKEQTFTYLSGNTGAAVEFVSNADTDGGTIDVERFDTSPSPSDFSTIVTSAFSPDETEVTPNVVSPERYWTITQTGLSSVTLRIYIDISGVGGISNPDKLVILTRSGAGVDWTPLDTERIGNTLYVEGSVSSFGDFAIGSNSSDNSLPVELTSFAAISSSDGIELSWKTAAELENLGFIIERSNNSKSDFTEIASYKSSDQLKGQGSTSNESIYAFTDINVQSGKTYYYRLSDVSYNGQRTYHSVAEVSFIKPVDQFKLYANYPNPFNPTTTIEFDVPADNFDKNVQVIVYDALGKEIQRLFSGKAQAGNYKVIWNGQDSYGREQASGVYFVNLKTGNVNQTQKMILIR